MDFCFYARVFMTDATNKEEIIPIRRWHNIFEHSKCQT